LTGSKTTGIALVQEKADGIAVLNLMALVHRGRQISQALRPRRALRRVGAAPTCVIAQPGSTTGLALRAGSRQAFASGRFDHVVGLARHALGTGVGAVDGAGAL